MVSSNAIIAEDDVSSDILEVDIWQEDLKVGRWQLIIKNIAHKWGDDIHQNDASELKINTESMLKGYVDDGVSMLDPKGVYTNRKKINGRDYGRDLARIKHTNDFVDVKADNILDIILSEESSEISYTSPSTAPVMTMQRDRTFLIDWRKTMAKRVAYSSYVDMNKLMHFFTHGAAAEESGVTLKSVATASDNNILQLLKGDEIGFSIANRVELLAGDLHGHYTDGNAVDFTPGTGVTITNDSTDKIMGTSSIKLSGVGQYLPEAWLDIYNGGAGRYSYYSLNLSEPMEAYYYLWHDVPTIGVYIRPRLKDDAGNIIEFKRTGNLIGVTQKGKTEFLASNKKKKLQFPIGESEHNIIKTEPTNNKWYYITGTSFNWSKVRAIGWRSAGGFPDGGYSVWIDALTIPTVDVIAKVSDAASEAAHGRSDYFDERPDIPSVIELMVEATRELAVRKDVLNNLKVTATFQSGSKYAGQSLEVWAPGHGIDNHTKYRIVKLHHRAGVKPVWKKHKAITEYDLIKHTIVSGIQVIDLDRYDLAKDPTGAALSILQLTRRRHKSSAEKKRDFGDTQPVETYFQELGFVHRKLPIYDPSGFHDIRTEEGVNTWTEAVTIKYPQYVETSYRIKGVAVQLRRTTDATKGTIQVKAEVSFNEGTGWTQLGSTMECESDTWNEYTATGDLSGDFDQPMWVKFSYRVYQEGAGSTDGYVKDCEAREHYSKTRWEDVEA